ncbi:MAG: PEGA domain-containing protein, partial [Methanocellales archaeon]
YTSWNYLKSLGIIIDPDPTRFEGDIATWPLEEQAVAWKTYGYNLLSKIGLALYNNPYLELAKTLGLAAIIGLVSASAIKKLIEDWRKPPSVGKGILRTQSDPANAEVYVDGAKVGNAGSIRDGTYRDYLVAAGIHTITFKLPDYRDKSYTIEIAADEINFVSAVLFPITLPSAVRYITPAGARGNVYELWFDVMPTERKVAQYEKGELVQIVEITREYLDFLYNWNSNAWRHCFEIYWGHPYEYYYPPPQPAPNVFTFDVSTQDLAGYLVVGAGALALGWLAYEFMSKASLAVGAYAGATLQFSRTIYNIWGDKLINWVRSAFPEYKIEVA